jgi:hypothetical protein
MLYYIKILYNILISNLILTIYNLIAFPAGAQQRRNNHSLTVAAAGAEPRREMSLQQKIRAFKFAVEERKKESAKSPPIAAILAVVAAVQAALQPLFNLIAQLQQQGEAISEAYNQFLAEETKSKWTWSKRNKKELALLAAFPPYTLGKKPR